MQEKRVARSVAAFVLVLGGVSVLTPTAHAAKECQGASGIVQCWDERVRECISNLSLPPSPC